MKIEIWSDYTCPFCYLGEKRMEEALTKLDPSVKVDIEFKSFELNPNAVSVPDKDIHQIIAEKYGLTYEVAKANNDRIIEAASEQGLSYDFEQLKPNNTFKAHELAKFAQSKGIGRDVTMALFHHYFEKGMDIGNEAELLNVAESFGLSRAEVQKVWDEETYKPLVLSDEAEAVQLGITSVPFFVIDGKYGVSGAQSPAHFLMAFKEALK